MLSILPGALILNQSYVFFTQNYDKSEQKIMFLAKNSKKYVKF